MVEDRSAAGGGLPSTCVGSGAPGHGGVIGSDLFAGAPIEPAGDPLHLRIASRAGGEVLQLAQGVSRVETGQAWGEVSVALAAGAVAGGAGADSPGFAAAKGDRLAGRFERIDGVRRRRAAGQGERGNRERENGEAGHRSALQPRRRIAGSTFGSVVAVAVLAAMSTACKPPPSARHDFDSVAVERGRAVAAAAGCAACHAFPDIAWPRGRAGPDLTRFEGHGPIAGALPNTPANLAAFVRNAPAAKPGSTMPAMPITPSEARDVAAYLYGISDD